MAPLGMAADPQSYPLHCTEEQQALSKDTVVDMDARTELSCNNGGAAELRRHSFMCLNARGIATMGICLVASVACVAVVIHGSSKVGYGVENTSNGIITLSHAEIDNQGVCDNALMKIERIIDARAIRLKEDMPKSELETDTAIKKGRRDGELLEAIEAILNEATWQDFIDAEAIIKERDMQDLARCMLGNSTNIEEDMPKGVTIAGGMNKNPRKWPGGQVGYCFHSSCRHSCKSAFHSARREIAAQIPCVTFRQKCSGGHIYIRTDQGGCSSYVGYQGRRQDLTLGSGCQYKGITIHEIFHALGFNHEQSRGDRNHYVTVHWNNIQDRQRHNFNLRETTDHTVYDFLSIMHYGATDFGKDGAITIEPKTRYKQGKVYMGQRVHASQYDISQLCITYGCRSSCKPQKKNNNVIHNIVPFQGNGYAPVTKSRCVCKSDWQYSGRRRYSKCTNSRNKGCCNPDGYSGGNWCFTTEHCKHEWDYCTPPKVFPLTVTGCRCKSGSTCAGTPSPWCSVAPGTCKGRTWDWCVPK